MESQQLARKASEWLNHSKNTKSAFGIADGSFAPGSAELTSDGRAHIAQVAQIVQADPQLRAQILALREDAQQAAGAQLDWSRAARIRNELIADHVAALNVTLGVQEPAALGAYHVIDEPGQRSHVFVVLSR